MMLTIQNLDLSHVSRSSSCFKREINFYQIKNAKIEKFLRQSESEWAVAQISNLAVA